MAEVRVDPLSGRRTLISAERAERPGAAITVAPAPAIDPADDPFAEGAEDRTPPELAAVRPAGGAPDGPGWTVRVVPNRFPAVTPDAPAPERDGRPDLFAAAPAAGAHEVIVTAPDPVTSLAALTPAQVGAAMEVWRERMRVHAGAAFRHLLVNERPEAGASVPHTHAQLLALGFVPSDVARERDRAGAYTTRTLGHDLLADLVQEEVRRRERIVAIDDDGVLLAPYASRLPYQLMIAPRTGRPRFEDPGPTCAGLLHEALSRLTRLLGATPPLNLWVRSAPSGADGPAFRIDVAPRVTHLAGLELGTGLHVNAVAPERAAAELRAA